MATEQRNLKVVMLPYLAYSHISSFLELAKRLSDRGGFSIELWSTPINLSFIKKKVSDNNKYSCSIQLVELHLPELPQLPPHYHTTNGLPSHLNPILFTAFKMTKPKLHQILEAKKPDVFIYDVMLLWAAGVASSLKIPALTFSLTAAPMSSYFAHINVKPGVEFPFPAIYFKDYEQKKADTGVVAELREDAKAQFQDDVVAEVEENSREGTQESGMGIILVNTSRAIDAKYLDYLSELCCTKVVPIGAQIQQDYVDIEDHDAGDIELFKWLGKQKEHSTVYISFGSEDILTKEEIEEMAYGLELSNVHFIWVVKFPRGEEVVNLEDVLPQGFLERIGERGRVVEGWVPQTRILKHPSIGAFLAHCGWNSILESIEFGVPIIALPMHADQPLNARLIVEIGVALEVARDGTGKFHRGKIAEIIKDVIFHDQIGKDMRRKVKTLGENVKLLRQKEMDEVVEVITELCDKSPSKKA